MEFSFVCVVACICILVLRAVFFFFFLGVRFGGSAEEYICLAFQVPTL